MQDSWTLRPIGIVHSAVTDPRALPANGLAATIEVFEPFAPALAQLDTNSHIWVIAWLHQAQRDTLETRGHHPRPGTPARGVFGLRAVDRPNPLGLSAARLLRVEGHRVYVDRLDFVDGTPVVDLKRYSPGWDAIFAARTTRETLPRAGDDATAIAEDLFLEAVHFHGEACVGAALAARMVVHVVRAWNIATKDPALRVRVGRDGCLADGLQAATGATLGSGRLTLAEEAASVRFSHGWKRLRVRPRPTLPLQAEDVLRAPESTLFGVEMETIADTI